MLLLLLIAVSPRSLATGDGAVKGGEAIIAPARLTVTFAGIHNATGDPALDYCADGLLWLLEDCVRSAKSLRLVPAYKCQPQFLVGPAEARRVGQAVEARRVLWGSYSRQGGKWSVVFHIENVAGAKTPPGLEIACATWPEVVDELSQKILGQLGVSSIPPQCRRLLRSCTSSTTAWEWLSKAKSAENRTDPVAQEAFARHAIEANPACPAAHELLAAALGTEGDTQTAEMEARTALKLDPSYADAHLVLGEVLQSQGRFAAGKKELQTSLRYDTENTAALIRFGETCEEDGDLQEAGKYFQRAVRADPLGFSPHAHLGRNYALRGYRQSALKELKTVAQASGDHGIDTEQHLYLGYLALNDLPAAAYYCQRFLLQAQRHHVNRERLESFKQNLRELQARFTYHFVQVTSPKQYSAAALDQSLRTLLSAEEREHITNPLTANVDMTNWAELTTSAATNDLQKARLLFDALLEHVNVGFGATRTAQEAFAAWKRRDTALLCQEYAFLYIALARAVGLEAYDVSVEEACDGSKVLHACAAVMFHDKALLVDPVYFWFGPPHKIFHVLNDLQVIALYLAEQGLLRDNEIAAKLDPTSTLVRGNLTAAQMEAGQWKEARRSLADFERSASDPAFADYLHAFFALHENRFEEAASLFNDCLKQNPDIAKAHFALGLVYQKLDKLPDARQAFRDALDYPLDHKMQQYARKSIAQINEKLADDE